MQPNDDPRELCGKLPGANILDATPENINDYCCGSWDLVVRDVEATLPAALACEVLAELARQRVPEAFALRLELVCLKKDRLLPVCAGQLDLLIDDDVLFQRDLASLFETSMPDGKLLLVRDVPGEAGRRWLKLSRAE